MNAYQVYRQTQAQTAAPGELVVMLYRGAVRFVNSGVTAIEAKDIQTAHNNLLSAQAIISELLQTLDLERGGEIARRLTSIYEYLLNRLVEANMNKDAAPAREVERFLRDLLPAWEEAARQALAGALLGARGSSGLKLRGRPVDPVAMSESHEIRVEPVAAARPAEPVQAALNVRRPALEPKLPKPIADAEQTDVAAATDGQLHGAYAEYLVDPDTQEVVVRIRDAATDRILDELPSREVQAMTRHMKEYAEMLARRAAMQQAQGS